MKKFQYVNSKENIPDVYADIEKACLEMGALKKQLNLKLLYVQILLDYISESYPENEIVTIETYSFFGDIRFRLIYKGEKLDVERLIKFSMPNTGLDDIDATQIQTVFIKQLNAAAFSNKYTSSKQNITTVKFKKSSSYQSLITLFISLFGGVAVGLLMRFAIPDPISSFIADNIFESISTIFTNSVKMLIGPLMFFTVSASIASYSDFSSLGRLGSKLIFKFLINAALALAVSTIIVLIMKPGVSNNYQSIAEIFNDSESYVDTVNNNSVSLKQTIVNFFPSNFFGSFVESSMMNIIVAALLVGAGSALLSSSMKESVCRFLETGNELFSNMIKIVMIFLPISVFCSMANTVVKIGTDTLLLLVGWLVALILAFVLMGAIYILIYVVIKAHISPITFLKKYSEAIACTFEMSSCNTSLPTCMTTLEEKLGVSNHITTLTMPIGVSLHCANSCAFYMISLAFLANIYNVTSFNPLMCPAIFFSILVLGIGAPSIPGSGPICVAMLLPQVGVPMSLMQLIIGLDPLVGMIKSACSTIEDASVTMDIAHSEQKIDYDILNS